jgi:hypothetical protein
LPRSAGKGTFGVFDPPFGIPDPVAARFALSEVSDDTLSGAADQACITESQQIVRIWTIQTAPYPPQFKVLKQNVFDPGQRREATLAFGTSPSVLLHGETPPRPGGTVQGCQHLRRIRTIHTPPKSPIVD